ncbi:MAG: hypothetical protein QM755_06715 [Luteolibacter sp.]
MAAGEERNGELLDDQLLTDDHLAELLAERLVGFAKFINGGDIVGRKLGGGRIGNGGFHVMGRVRNLAKTKMWEGFVENWTGFPGVRMEEIPRHRWCRSRQAEEDLFVGVRLGLWFFAISRLPEGRGLLNHPPPRCVRLIPGLVWVTRIPAKHGTHPRY